MNRFIMISQIEFKLMLRNFMTVFFSLVFPIMMLAIFGGMYGNVPSKSMNGFGAVDVMVPSYICMVIAVSGIMSLPMTIAQYREKKILKRFMASPISPMDILYSQVFVNFIMTVAGMIVLMVVGFVAFDLHFNGNVLWAILSFILITLSIFSLGLLIAGVSPDGKTANVISYLIYFPMLFLSGAAIPIEIMPKAIVTISKFLPLTYGVDLLKGVWLGQDSTKYLLDIVVLAGILILCSFVSLKAFKWE